jgi:alpha-1,2-mannosyltransferase
MADTCSTEGASTCSTQHSFPFMDSKFLSQVALPILCLSPLVPILIFPLLWRVLGSFLGWYLRKKTDGRRCHILELVEADEKAYQEESRKRSGNDGGENGGLEKVDASTLGAVRDGAQGDDDSWDGIVGFFHPFW